MKFKTPLTGQVKNLYRKLKNFLKSLRTVQGTCLQILIQKVRTYRIIPDEFLGAKWFQIFMKFKILLISQVENLYKKFENFLKFLKIKIIVFLKSTQGIDLQVLMQKKNTLVT